MTKNKPYLKQESFEEEEEDFRDSKEYQTWCKQ
jgi:hypothetical protein